MSGHESFDFAALRPAGASCRGAQSAQLHDGGFRIADNRYDPLVGMVLNALHRLTTQTGPFPASTAIIAVTEFGCSGHVARVVQALSDGLRPRQAIFARASATMLATYPALALSSHGPTFALSGGAATLRWALALSVSLMRLKKCEAAVLVAADTLDDPAQYQASVMRVGPNLDLVDPSSWGDGPHLDELPPSAVLAAWLDFANVTTASGNKGHTCTERSG
ncbi:hypothetical protein [Burkholderia ambifaria]|uniref:hypothetical protein n=1 Tax=Burkholderia ambifaria TaxID=152480 RepID=UPI00158A90CF|nr:hypothetical protein [Burkholderia ambifaria]MBR8343533.1 hypothetical protein [Burkholderia ambifaria]